MSGKADMKEEEKREVFIDFGEGMWENGEEGI